jgi:UrcA family protein
MRIHRAAICIAGSIGLTLLASPSAFAQCGAYGGYEQPKENVTVSAPRIRPPTIGWLPNLLNTPPGRATASQRVSYADLDLCTPEGARELRDRVRKAAAENCDLLASNYYAHALPSAPSCYRDAVNSAMPRADSAIAAARNNQ